MNLKDSITNKTYCLILAQVLARDIFMSKSVTGLFPCGGISKSCYLSCLILSNFSFLSLDKIFRLSYLIISDPYYFGRGPMPFLLSCKNTNTEPLSQNSMSLVQQPEINQFKLAVSFSRPAYSLLSLRGLVLSSITPNF